MSEDAAPALRIRAAGESDAAELARLSAQLGYPADARLMIERLAQIGARTDHAVFVAESAAADAQAADGAADRPPALLGWIHVAYGMRLESGESAEIVGLVVDSGMRRGGVGRQLVEAAERWSRAAGLERIVVRSKAARTEAHSFYPALGYVLTKTQRVYGRPLAG